MSKIKVPPLCGSKEVADILHIERTSVPSVRKLKGFPLAIQELASGPIWIKNDILEFEKSRVKKNSKSKE